MTETIEIPTVKRWLYVGRNSDGNDVVVDLELRPGPQHDAQTIDHEPVAKDSIVAASFTFTETEPRYGKVDPTVSLGAGVKAALEDVKRHPNGAGLYPKERARLAELAERWHLSDMKAGCAHQPSSEQLVARYGQSNIAERALREVEPCRETGYKWGSAWLVEPVPADVQDELVTLAETARQRLVDSTHATGIPHVVDSGREGGARRKP